MMGSWVPAAILPSCRAWPLLLIITGKLKQANGRGRDSNRRGAVNLAGANNSDITRNNSPESPGRYCTVKELLSLSSTGWRVDDWLSFSHVLEIASCCADCTYGRTGERGRHLRNESRTRARVYGSRSVIHINWPAPLTILYIGKYEAPKC